MAASVIVTPNSIVRMIVSATTDGAQAVASGTGRIGVDGRVSEPESSPTEAPTSPQRHEPHHPRIADYHCTLISEEPSPLCVKVSAAEASCQHVVIGTQSENIRRMARMRRGGGRRSIPSGGLWARRERSVALRTVLRERGWDRAAVEAARLGDMPTLW
jgi:hypothetical protein